MKLMNRLGELAANFRGTNDASERKKIANQYEYTWRRIVDMRVNEIPSAEDQLPYDYMPKSFMEDIESLSFNEDHVLYSTDGKGNWWRREWKSQCNEEVFMSGRCQGVQGHKGVHWSFKPCGSFAWDDNDESPEHDGCSGSTPPDHKEYKTPKEMQQHYYMSHYEDSVVTDPTIIAMLEKGDTPEKSASLTRPLSKEEAEKFKKEYPDRV